MWGRLVIHIAGIYHEVTKSRGLTLGRFKPCSRLKFLPMLCHLRVTGHLDGYLYIYLDSEEDILAGLLWQETLCWRTLPPAPDPSSWFSTDRELCLLMLRPLRLSWQPERRQSRPGWAGLCDSKICLPTLLYTLVRFITHTLAQIHICSRWHVEAYADRLCQAHKWPHGHIPYYSLEPIFPKCFTAPRGSLPVFL